MTFTKERLIALSNRENVGAILGDEIAELARIALASLEAEAVTCPKCNGTGMADSGGVQPWGEPINVPCGCAAVLQGAEQQQNEQQNIPENIPPLREAVDTIRNSGIAIDAEKILAERDALNGPVIPDGWVACSERMPLKRVNVLVFDAGGNKFICCHENGFWRDYRVGFSRHEIIYWMPLPAALQQEVK